MKHIIDYRGYMIFKIKPHEYVIKLDTPDGLLSVGQPFRTSIEAMVAIDRKAIPHPTQPPSWSQIKKIIVDFFNIWG